jgi:hypothetical protein
LTIGQSFWPTDPLSGSNSSDHRRVLLTTLFSLSSIRRLHFVLISCSSLFFFDLFSKKMVSTPTGGHVRAPG